MSDVDYESTMILRNMMKDDPAILQEYSTKLKYIGDKILNSLKSNNNGPIFVYSDRIARGLLPIIYYLEANGFSLISK
jgi:hypothetical protein